MVKFQVKGDWKKTGSFFEKTMELVNLGQLDKYGEMGVHALSAMTPVDTGETARSWTYTIERNDNSVAIVWRNNNLSVNGTPIAIYIQYGHATLDGSFVQGTDFVNPAMVEAFSEIAELAWKEVTTD